MIAAFDLRWSKVAHAKGVKMYLLNEKAVGLGILLLLGAAIVVKRTATGSFWDKPVGSFLVWFENVFNLCFLLIGNPLAAWLLIAQRLHGFDPTHVSIPAPWLLGALELGGAMLYLLGWLLLAWAMIELGGNYQLGGAPPRPTDDLVITGPYQFVRHPMYMATLCISLGLSCLLQSVAYAVVFGGYVALIILLIPIEEAGLEQQYGPRYSIYQEDVSRLIPMVY